MKILLRILLGGWISVSGGLEGSPIPHDIYISNKTQWPTQRELDNVCSFLGSVVKAFKLLFNSFHFVELLVNGFGEDLSTAGPMEKYICGQGRLS